VCWLLFLLHFFQSLPPSFFSGLLDDRNRSHGASRGGGVENVAGILSRFAGVDLALETRRTAAASAKELAAKEAAAAAKAAAQAAATFAADGGGDGSGGGGEEVDGPTASFAAPEGYVPWVEHALVDEDVATSLGRREVIRMGTPCPNCSVAGETLTCFTDIPHFKEVADPADAIHCHYFQHL
jgi:hypothetical protein